jgi:hypothetical protein
VQKQDFIVSSFFEGSDERLVEVRRVVGNYSLWKYEWFLVFSLPTMIDTARPVYMAVWLA